MSFGRGTSGGNVQTTYHRISTDHSTEDVFTTRTVSHLRSRQCGELEVQTMPLELLSLPTSWMNADSA